MAGLRDMPPFKLGIHILQSLIAIIILGCSIARLSEYSTDGFALAVFTSIATILVVSYILSSSFISKRLYKFWLEAGGHIFTLIFWVATVGALAHYDEDWGCHYQHHHHCDKKRDDDDSVDGVWAATIALSVIDGLLSLVSLGVSFWMKKKQKYPSTDTREGEPMMMPQRFQSGTV